MRQKQRVFSLFLLSPSSRRAWIEIENSDAYGGTERVALLAEGVDRNSTAWAAFQDGKRSPSSRRAWIEILTIGTDEQGKVCRPPRGGRG